MANFRAVVIADSTGIGGSSRNGPSHGLHQTFDQHPDVDLVALSDPSEDNRSRWIAESGATTGYSDYEKMLATENPDIAIIAIHNYNQARLETFLAFLILQALSPYAFLFTY